LDLIGRSGDIDQLLAAETMKINTSAMRPTAGTF
jgi:hypothetical protein